MAKKIPYGLTDYFRIVTEDFYYVDKTKYIEDLEKTGRVVVAVIVVGNGNRKAFIQVADIFIAQRIRRIFGMARNIKLTSAARHRHINARLLALRKKRQLRHLPDIFATYFGI